MSKQKELSKNAYDMKHGAEDQHDPVADQKGTGNRGRYGRDDRRFLTRPEAAEYLTSHGFCVTKLTLQKWATVGGGPIYRLFGNRALYTSEDLLAWAEAKLSEPRRSTSEATA